MIGVAIPCYSGHAHLLNSLLENIYNSTVKPAQIAVSCSSWNKDEEQAGLYKDIPIKVKYSKRQINQAENRNLAAGLLDTELISFIDADDLMHPQRIEYIIKAFQQSTFDVIYHSFVEKLDSQYNDIFGEIGQLKLSNNAFEVDPNNKLGIVLKGYENGVGCHNAHLTVKRKIMKRFKFDENWEVYRSEDSLFTRMLVENKVRCGYIDNKLSRYIGVVAKN